MSKASEIAASMSSIGNELEKEATEFEEKIAEEVVEKKPFKMSDYIKPQLIEESQLQKEASNNITDKAKKKYDEAESGDKAKAGAGLAGAGAALTKHTYDRGNLTGRETLYHNTRAENVKSIKKNGLKGQFATDKSKAFTPDVLSHLDESELKGKVYMARKKQIAKNVGIAAQHSDAMNGKGDFKRETLKAKVPTWKMKEVDNPELLGAKSGDEYISKLIKEKKNEYKAKGMSTAMLKNLENDPATKLQGKMAYKMLGKKGTAVIQGDIDAKYIKGHSGYKGANAKEVAQFIKHNPKRFVKGVGQAGAGVALAGVGAKVMKDAYKKRQAEKIACVILEEAGFLK